MSELNQRRTNRDTDCFYEVMDQYYGKGPLDEKHASPTKRLIKYKNTTVENKKVLCQTVSTGDYSINYTTAPGRSYIIEPQSELNYKLANKNPEKFYHQVFNTEVMEHKAKSSSLSPVRKSITVTSKVTTRSHMKMMEKIKYKIAEKMREKIGESFEDKILLALKDKAIEH